MGMDFRPSRAGVHCRRPSSDPSVAFLCVGVRCVGVRCRRVTTVAVLGSHFRVAEMRTRRVRLCILVWLRPVLTALYDELGKTLATMQKSKWVTG